MRYLLIENLQGHRKVIQVENTVVVINRLRARGYKAYEVENPPCLQTIRQWIRQGKCKAICGCWIDAESGSRCPIHHAMSWLTVYLGSNNNEFALTRLP